VERVKGEAGSVARRGPTPSGCNGVANFHVGAILLLAAVGGCGESTETAYPNFNAASGAVSMGWIPAWLPRSAYEIREAHGPDTQESLVKFRYQRSETLQMGEDCEPIKSAEAVRPSLRARWWPADVPGDASVANRYVVFRCSTDHAFVAIAPSGEIFHWRSKR
jgi:hypothetical protein